MPERVIQSDIATSNITGILVDISGILLHDGFATHINIFSGQSLNDASFCASSLLESCDKYAYALNISSY